ncbi:TetR/AcrR family transcriptional regulator [Streptomyces platensis]|uniref:HTH-type transcriptional repressor KstR n=1 Tax=Streptomyces platensis TaxID=58346 RepID=A0AAE6NHX8_STRPT|nr:TetR/AcrR family transcriptional regulator [Streptomyces platensis]OSY36067.1 HTH-type transcriptional repressor KstR [Streptomyces platensis]QEV52195.1 TetR/AcrR family transcriptional regulator [Streptomyces platensis]BCK71638.1 TetR family transcriptional regulator [Streptomyces libani subsp. rufus]
MANTSTPDSSRRSERSRRAIFDAALALVGEVGYDKLTIEGIASRAGVGKQTIYRWWPSKAAVLLDAFTATVDDYDAKGLPDTGDLAADLKFVLRATADEFNDPAFQAPYRALAAAGANDEELSRTFVARLSEPGTRLYVDRLRAAQETGEVAADIDVRIAAEMLLSPFSQRWLMRTGELTYDFVDTLVDQVLRGLRPRG